MKKSDIEDKIIIGYPKLRISLPVLIAFKKNFFKKYKLSNVEIKEYETAEDMMKSFVSSDDKLYLGGFCALPIALNTMQEHKLDFLFLAGIHEDDEHPISFLLIKNSNTNIKNIEDLNGKTIGILPTIAYRVWIKQILKKNGVDIDTVVIIDVPTDKQASSLSEGEIDALFTNDPTATLLKSNKKAKEILPGKALVPKALALSPFYFGSFIVNKIFYNANPKIIHRIALALDDAISEINKNSYIVDEVIKEYLPKLQELVEDIPKINFRKINEISASDLEIVEKCYYHQGVCFSSNNIKKSQYRLVRWRDLGKIYFFEFSHFLEKSWKILSLIAYPLVLAIAFVIANIKINDLYSRQLSIQNKSEFAQFDFLYSYKNEQYKVKLLNIGKSKPVNIRTEWEIYFISKDDMVYQASNMKEVAKLNISLFQKIKDNNITNDLIGLDGLFGLKNRKLLTAYLMPNDSIPLDSSSIAINNALKLNEAMGTEMFTRWKIKYNEELSGKQRVIYKYIWFDNKDDLKNEKQKDLEDVVGGMRIIKLIRTYERDTKNIVF